MNIHFSKISFKQNLLSNKTSEKNKNRESFKLSEFNKQGRNEVVSEPIDNIFAERKTKNGIVRPSSYDDCYEKMSFEKNNEPDIWNDSYYEDEVNVAQKTDYKEALFGLPATHQQYFYKDYSYDDIPLSDSLIRKEVGLYETPNIEIDKGITYEGDFRLKHLNYLENIVPSALHCEPATDKVTIYSIASDATMLSNQGYSRQSIVRALERCTIKDNQNGTSYAEPRLFEFLVKHPNLRPDAVPKNSIGVEYFDKAYVDCFSILNEHYFDNEKDIRQALNLCKVESDGISLVDRELCELVGLIRLRTAQGLPPKKEITYGYHGERYNKQQKYCDKNVPLSENDILLINKIKQNGKVDHVMLGVAKELLSENKETVASVLESIDSILQVIKYPRHSSESVDLTLGKLDNFVSEVDDKNEKLKEQFARARDIKTLIKELREKPEKHKGHVEKIEFILESEYENIVAKGQSFKENSFLFEIASVLNKQNQYSPYTISILLNKFKLLHSRLKDFDMQAVDKYVNVIATKSNKGELRVDNRLNKLLTDMCLYSGKMGDAELGVIKKLKSLTGNDRYQTNELVDTMMRHHAPVETILNNMDESLDYYNKARKIATTLYSNKCPMKVDIEMALNNELRNTCYKKNFSCKNSELLQLAEKIVAGEVEYEDVKDKFRIR